MISICVFLGKAKKFSPTYWEYPCIFISFCKKTNKKKRFCKLFTLSLEGDHKTCFFGGWPSFCPLFHLYLERYNKPSLPHIYICTVQVNSTLSRPQQEPYLYIHLRFSSEVHLLMVCSCLGQETILSLVFSIPWKLLSKHAIILNSGMQLKRKCSFK